MIDLIKRRPLTSGLTLAAVVILAIMLLGRLGIEPALTLLDRIEGLVAAHFWPSWLLFIAAFVTLAFFALPVGTLFCLAGGYLFGIWLGAGAALAGASIAAALTFLVVRRFGGRILRRRLERSGIEPWVKRIEGDATWYVMLSRIVPVAPFFVVNAAAGMSHLAAWRFNLASSLGLIPITVIYAGVGNGLGSMLEAREMMGPALLLEPHIGLPLAALVLLIVTSWLLKHWIEQQ